MTKKGKIFSFVVAPLIVSAMALNIGFFYTKMTDPNRHNELKTVLAKNGYELKEIVRQNGSKQRTQTTEAIVIAQGQEKKITIFRVNENHVVTYCSPNASLVKQS